MNRTFIRRIALAAALALPAATVVIAASAGPASAEPDSPHAVPNPLLKEVLGEEDEGLEDNPALNALCQDLISQPNLYGNPAPNVNQIVNDTVVEVGSQTGCRAAQNETSIAVNPHNPRNIVAGANDYRFFNSREQRNDSSGVAYTSFDGGRTWRNITLPGLTFQTGGVGPFSYIDGAGDPVIAFGPRNTVYFGNIVFSRTPFDGGQQASGIVVNVSHDGGLHWSDPVAIQMDGVTAAGTPVRTNLFNDKVWLGADPDSGRAYVSWTVFTNDDEGNYVESPIVVSSTSDFGRTWSAKTRVSPSLDGFSGGITPFAQGSNPRVARDGTLHIAYETSVCDTADCDGPDDRDAVVVATSTDRGRTFRHSIVDTDFDFPTDEDTGSAGLTGENFRINSFPQLGYDPVADRLWVTWADDRNGRYTADGESIRTNGDNIVSTSRDGRHWSEPVVVGTPQDEVFGAVTAFAGHVAIASYTRHFDPAGINLDFAYWQAGLFGFRGARTHRITTVSENPQVQFVGTGLESGETLQGLFIGDYAAVAIGSDLRIHPCWTDFRGRPGTNTANQDAYTQSIRIG